MSQSKRQLLWDVFFIVASVSVAVFIVRTGIVHTFIDSFGNLRYVGSFIAGMFFTSVFTVVPSAAVLGELSQSNSVFMVALTGGLGAVVGDYIIFRFVRDRFAEDIRFLLRYSGVKRFPAIFQTRLFRWVVPFIGAVVIASPLPDEIGLTMLGFSGVGNRTFLITSFVCNAIGILAIGWAAKAFLW